MYIKDRVQGSILADVDERLENIWSERDEKSLYVGLYVKSILRTGAVNLLLQTEFFNACKSDVAKM
jgi:hypothetical protein